MGEPIVSLKKVNKFFGSNHVIKDMDLDINEGEFLTLLGPSGCGKTTILRMIAGFEDATNGVIEVQGERVEEKEAYERDVNTVFQSYALFPHMTVYDNIAYGLTVKKVPKDQIRERVKEMLELVQLMGFEGRKPDMMSGGQKQRVAIARALINNPKVLLLDEPLGALDLQLRKQMQIELKRLQKLLNITFVYVTHDQEEAMTMSDRIAVMNAGVIEHLASPSEIYNQPKTRFVANFIGESNIFTGEVKKMEDHIAEIKVEQGNVKMELSGFEQGEQIHVCVRPEVMKYSKTPIDGFSLEGTVKNVIFVGAQYRTLVTMDNGYDVKINRVKHDNDLKEGDRIYLYWDLEDATGIKAQEVEA
ncbi:ABC transporter ATP-binding protein [Zhenpiania hominis]|uniref:Spermidine/putrescine import ATP-binding protein PotA n=1 Tax=Zhenpiania hominis TaxID=2763644 RepID=A0A923NL23_9FIRM|nr:ABC transporter ATP-binding protein [Zhenpiania hominis]MBC6678575.1 ABC transporter ATP-binding protein [Zhenpiania hominis]